MSKILVKFFHPKVLLVLLAAFLVLMFAFNWWNVDNNVANIFKPADVNGNVPGAGGNVPASPGQQCNPAATITLQYADELGGQSISPNATLKINGGNSIAMSNSASGQISDGDKVQMLLNASGYPATMLPPFTVGCSTNPISGVLLSQYKPGLAVLGSQGVVLTNAYTGATNDTGGGANAVTQTLRITPTGYNGTGNLVLVVDANTSSIVSSITSAGFQIYSRGKPNNYQPQAAASRVQVFVIPNSLSVVNVPITFNPTGSINALKVNYTVYTAQDFQDINGNFVNGIEDSNGNAKWFAQESTVDFIN